MLFYIKTYFFAMSAWHFQREMRNFVSQRIMSVVVCATSVVRLRTLCQQCQLCLFLNVFMTHGK